MAIQMRRGKFTNFLPSKLQPGEWAIVQGDDPSASDGLSVYVAFAAGVVKRMATYTDMVDNCRDAIEQSIGDIKAKLTAKVEATNASVEGAESKRVAAESSRVSAESSRATAEQGRVEAERSRVSAESSRKSAEERRAADQLKNNADQAQNNAAAKGLTYKVCGSGEYKVDAVDNAHNVPTVIGRDGTMYLTPKVKGATDEDKYDQWMYIDSKWELMGESGAHIDPTTTGDVDTIVSGTNVTADRYLNATGLSYFWVKAVDKLESLFAPKAHSHTVSDVTGTVAVENGGTGATTAADALTNLGAAAQTDVDALRDSVSQYHPVGSVVFLANGKSPSSLGIPGTWVRTYFSIVTNKRLAFDIKDGNTGTNGANVQIYSYNGSDAQQFWFYAKNYGDIHMWVRTA